MTALDPSPQDGEVAQLAANALTAAQARAMKSGRSVLVLVDGELVRIEPRGKTVVKKLPPRRKVRDRFKRATL